MVITILNPVCTCLCCVGPLWIITWDNNIYFYKYMFYRSRWSDPDVIILKLLSLSYTGQVRLWFVFVCGNVVVSCAICSMQSGQFVCVCVICFKCSFEIGKKRKSYLRFWVLAFYCFIVQLVIPIRYDSCSIIFEKLII